VGDVIDNLLRLPGRVIAPDHGGALLADDGQPPPAVQPGQDRVRDGADAGLQRRAVANEGGYPIADAG
jgi:hypothetical protein